MLVDFLATKVSSTPYIKHIHAHKSKNARINKLYINALENVWENLQDYDVCQCLHTIHTYNVQVYGWT